MSVEVLKAGVSDSIQDEGRFGYQHVGINPTGAMDVSAMIVANALVGNKLNEAVIEIRFPASTLYFNQSALIALSGADFSAKLNGESIPVNQPVFVRSKSELKFTRLLKGNFLYLAIHGGLECSTWLGSTSTNTKALLGGIEGRVIRKHDYVSFKKEISEGDTFVFPWRARTDELYSDSGIIRCVEGNEFDWLSDKSQKDLLKTKFKIKSTSDRMGYQLQGVKLNKKIKNELLSTAVDYGTVQLLPAGDLIVLMADHQTTGGYPRVAHVIRGDRATFAQHTLNEKFTFEFVRVTEAETIAFNQQRIVKQLEFSCALKFNEYIKPMLA
jgi:antagonist of KipI